MSADAAATKPRSGTGKRQRTELVGLRLLPAEGDALRALARKHGHSSVQALILDTLQPLIGASPPSVSAE